MHKTRFCICIINPADLWQMLKRRCFAFFLPKITKSWLFVNFCHFCQKKCFWPRIAKFWPKRSKLPILIKNCHFGQIDKIGANLRILGFHHSLRRVNFGHFLTKWVQIWHHILRPFRFPLSPEYPQKCDINLTFPLCQKVSFSHVFLAVFDNLQRLFGCTPIAQTAKTCRIVTP